MGERILLPLDGTKSGERALKQVQQLISDLQPRAMTEIVLFQVVKPPVRYIPVEGGVVEIEGDPNELEEKKRTALEYIRKTAKGLNTRGITVSCEVVVGTPGASVADGIIKAEKELKGDMVAMTAPVRKGLRRWAPGSITEKVLREGGIPVMAVRAGA